MVETEQKRYADDITTQELVRLRVENERLREALKKIADATHSDWFSMKEAARAVLKGDD